ncbi:hypothetical protein [Rhizobium sp. Leaf341]|uniref:hypothetical protein n=1 Tax=Rhizobium sp. Leaf341 TaxID=1736344 RepID=UPI0007158BE7|nr:hypothetical protein [Rhizobium sp. Leaf341]KQR67855.1 hypothetical protein ASG03_10065 [Rhizobium sp. Leaf341]
MTRKDYVLISKAIKRAVDQWSGLTPERGDVEAALSDLASDLAGELAADNPRFEANRFLSACGLD